MIIVTGTIAYDYIMDFPGSFSDHILPERIHKINLSFIVNKFAKRRGGTAGNVAYSLGLLKTPHVLFSFAGSDFDEYKKGFEKFGLSTNAVQIDNKSYTATGFAMTDKTNNQIWGFFNGASENLPSLNLSSVSSKNDFVLIGPGGALGSMSIVKQCIKNNISYMFDPGFILTQVSDSDLSLGIKNCNILIGNDYEISLMQKRCPDFEKITKDKTIITTLGEKGAVSQINNQKTKVMGVKIKNVVDPSGAGDAFRSGFLAGYEKKLDLKTCLQMGCTAASFAVEHYGAQEHKYSISEFIKRYRQAYGTLLKL